ncbi:hypothetical protein KDL01_19285 [Actinospica durhamensis]|uniref:Methylamine utilization protein MauE n=1 Tax=Actinospica durhamensis TaxID=1508375 RepID=A0A941EPB7_9ACTN|nr:hypothetical protein [Actinospica durhamensis]MBR7835427.1 hypothetical protein [Actinospica durhamensis]
MTEPQSWPPLCAAVAGCGALLVLSGAAKLVRTARGTGDGTAVQKALRLNDRRWRGFQAAAGCAEAGVGLLVCAGGYPAVADTLMAVEGAVFVALLSTVIFRGIPGDCGCAARTRRPEAAKKQAVTGWTVARAGCIALAGAVGALAGVRPPAELPGADAASAWALALVTLALLTLADLEVRTPRCRRALLFPARTTLAEVTEHRAFRAVAAPWGFSGDRVLFRRTGCVDEFWFPVRATGHAGSGQCYLEVRAGRVASGALALRTAVAEHAPSDHVKTLAMRQR